MSIQEMRFSSKVEARRVLANVAVNGEGEVKQDERGWYVECELHPLVAALPTQAEVDALPKAHVEPKPARPAPVARKADGACAMIREWARQNPEATKEDGVKQFPDLNPSTIAIQMRKVRLGQV